MFACAVLQLTVKCVDVKGAFCKHTYIASIKSHIIIYWLNGWE